MRRSELPHERQKANLDEPLASKSWWQRTDKYLINFAKNGVFQHNRRRLLPFDPPQDAAVRPVEADICAERSIFIIGVAEHIVLGHNLRVCGVSNFESDLSPTK